MRAVVSIISLLFCTSVFYAQTLSGFVYDAQSGEKLIGAYIYDSASDKGTVSNEFGFYALKRKNSGQALLNVSFIGYKPLESIFYLNADSVLNLPLFPTRVLRRS